VVTPYQDLGRIVGWLARPTKERFVPCSAGVLVVPVRWQRGKQALNTLSPCAAGSVVRRYSVNEPQWGRVAMPDGRAATNLTYDSTLSTSPFLDRLAMANGWAATKLAFWQYDASSPQDNPGLSSPTESTCRIELGCLIVTALNVATFPPAISNDNRVKRRRFRLTMSKWTPLTRPQWPGARRPSVVQQPSYRALTV